MERGVASDLLAIAQFNKNILTRQEKGGFKSEPHALSPMELGIQVHDLLY